MGRKRILIFGATGMLGHVLLRHFSRMESCDVYATSRDTHRIPRLFSKNLAEKFLQEDIDANDFDAIDRALVMVKPQVVINCIGIIKQKPMAQDPHAMITINALLPHRLSIACHNANARMIHISTDCVFDGLKGMYTEKDRPAPEDLYGRTKLLGEVEYPGTITLRTSIIGHELDSKYGLIEWFLGESEKVRGYTNAVYSGFPSIELARIIFDYILPDVDLTGIYHVSSDPVTKYELLHLVAGRYDKRIHIEPWEDFVLNRSLVSDRFRSKTGYKPPEWPDLIDAMYSDYENSKEQYSCRS